MKGSSSTTRSTRTPCCGSPRRPSSPRTRWTSWSARSRRPGGRCAAGIPTHATRGSADMRDVEVTGFLPAGNARQVFDTLVEFERYPDLVEVVKSVEILSPPGAAPMVSRWVVYFRNGTLSWTEADRLDRDAGTIDFVQTDGDFGVPTLAAIIDPVAERVLVETIQLILRALLPAVEFTP